MEIIDISRDILKTPVYPGDPEGYLDEIKSMTVLGKHKLNFYIGENVYQIKGDASFNALKYMQMYYHQYLPLRF